MATTCLTNYFRRDILNGVIDIGDDTIKMALYAGQSHSQTTTAYTSSGEASGTNYTAKGNTLAGATDALDNTNHVAYYDFNDTSWSSATITADSCLIYSDTVTSQRLMFQYMSGTSEAPRAPVRGHFPWFFPQQPITLPL